MEITPGDVIKVEKPHYYLGEETVFTIQELKRIIGERSFQEEENRKATTAEGLPCEFLSVDGGGWQKGRFRVSVEFIADS